MGKKVQKTDGLGPLEIKKIRSAVRLVWQRCHARALVIKRCTDPDGYLRCEKCRERTPSLKVDHTKRCGDVLEPGYLIRLFIPSVGLQGMCPPCHDIKTAIEREEARPLGVGKDTRRKRRRFTDNF